jgi:hypothetical protein
VQRELDHHPFSHLVELVGLPPDSIHHLIEGVEVAPHTLVPPVGVGLGGELRRGGRLELRMDEGQEPLDAVLVEGLEAPLDGLDVLAGHRNRSL